MTLRIRTVTLPFREPDGSDTGATFTIREELSHQAMLEYLEAVSKVSLNGEGDERKVEVEMETELHLRNLTEILLRHGLVRLDGVEDVDGNPLPLERFMEFDSYYVRQVANELAKRASEQKPDPNSIAPSGRF